MAVTEIGHNPIARRIAASTTFRPPEPGAEPAVHQEGHMSWVMATIAAWILVAIVACLIIGRGIRLADHRATQAAPEPDAPNVVADPIAQSAAGMTSVAAEGDAGPASRSASMPHARPTAHHGVPAARRAGADRHTGHR
jgi:hypothetical protein